MTPESSPRTRTAVIGAAVVVILAVAVVAIVHGTRGGAPAAAPHPSHPTASRTADGLKVGAPLAAYVDPDSGVLSIDGVAQRGTWGGASSTNGLTLGVSSDPTGSTVGIFVRGARAGTMRHVVDGVVLASPDTRTISWMEHVGGSVHLVAASVTRSGIRELGRIPLDPSVLEHDNEGAERVMKVDDDRTVTYGGILGGRSWKPGHAPRRADVSVLLTRAHGFPNTYEPPDVNPSGTWGVWRSTPTGRSPHNDETPLRAVTVQQPNRPGTRITFPMPPNDEVQWAYWETDADVIVAVSSTPPVAGEAIEASGYVRCNVVSHACEYAPTR